MDTTLKKHQNPQNCSYCNERLNPEFYFCQSCSKPYKNVESVTSPQLRVYKSSHTLVKERSPGAFTVFWVYFSFILGVGILNYAIYGDGAQAQVFFSILFVIVTVILMACYWSVVKVQFWNFGFNHLSAYLALLMLIPFLIVNAGLSEFFQYVSNESSQDFLTEMDLSYTTAIIIICVIPGIFEEIGFRGILQSQLMKAVSVKKAIYISAFLFALVHFNILHLPYLFLLGILLGWVNWKTKSLYPSILIHFLHNFFVITYF
jgi:membrane protease YdiL (CAAX protease family)